MAKTFRLLADNTYLDATLTASSEAVGLPVEATQHFDRLYVWRSLVSSGEDTIDVDLGSAQLVSCVGVANLTLKGAGALVLETRGTGGSPGAATTLTTITAQDAGTRVAVVAFDAVTVRHLRLRWTNPTSAVTYAEAGFVGVGVPFSPSRNVGVPVDWSLVDPSVRTSAIDGAMTTTARTMYRVGTFTWPGVTTTDRDGWDAVYQAIGSRIPVFVSLDADTPWQAALVRLDGQPRQTLLPHAGLFAISVAWEEAR